VRKPFALPHPALIFGSLAILSGLLIAQPPAWMEFPVSIALMAACEGSRRKRANRDRSAPRAEIYQIT